MNATIPPDGRWPAPPQNETRLESWGEIASYLRKDVRTVQRWERTLELPVRRLHVAKISSVYAYRTELDKWYLERQPPDEHTETQKNSDAPVVKTTESLDKEESQDFDKGKKFAKFWQLAMVAVVVLATAWAFIITRLSSAITGRLNLSQARFAFSSGPLQITVEILG